MATRSFIGQKTAAESQSVVFASDASSVAVSLADGLTSVDVVIANSASLSGEGDLGSGKHLCGIIVPSGWTTAVLSFAAALVSGGTFYPLYTASGAEVVTGSIVGGTAVWVALDPADFAGVRYVKVRSGTAGTPVTQSGGDTLTLVTRVV